jgi:hypothetical protein
MKLFVDPLYVAAEHLFDAIRQAGRSPYSRPFSAMMNTEEGR